MASVSSTEALPPVASSALLAAVSEPAFVREQCLHAWNAPAYAGLEHLLAVAGYAVESGHDAPGSALPAAAVLNALGEVYHFAHAARQALAESLPGLLRRVPVARDTTQGEDPEPVFELSAAPGPYSQFYVALTALRHGMPDPTNRHTLFARRSGKYEHGQRLFEPSSSFSQRVRSARALQTLGEQLALCDMLHELSLRVHIRVGMWPLLGETGLETLDASERARLWWRPRYDKACVALTDNQAAALAYAQRYFGTLGVDELEAMFERTGVDIQPLSDELKGLLGRRPQRDNIFQMRTVLERLQKAREEHAELRAFWTGS